MVTLEIAGGSDKETNYSYDWPAKKIMCPHCDQKIEFMYALTTICPHCHKILGVDADIFKYAFSRLLFFRKVDSEYTGYGGVW